MLDSRQVQEARDLVQLHGGIRKAARAAGIAESTLRTRLKAKAAAEGSKRTTLNIAFIPDVQAKPKTCFKFLGRVGKYIADKQPDVIVQVGDFADMESLSTYDAGMRSFEGRRYKADIAASHEAMDALMTPIAKVAGYNPEMHLTLGNHEDRIDRTTNKRPELYELISVGDLNYRDYGWQVHPFLKPVNIGGVMFAHYFISGVMGRPIGTSSAMVNKLHMSAMAGHQQGKQTSTGRRADGSMITCTIAGSCYEHDEGYLGPQGNRHWRGLIFMHDVRNGEFDEMAISLSYLANRYRK